MMKKQLLAIILLGIIVWFPSACSDLDDNEEVGRISPEAVIQQESELFDLISRVAETEDDDEITCIKFLYSFTMLEFDADLTIVGDYTVMSDPQFSDILENIPPGNSIGISFPIQSILESGEELLIQNKEELKQSIDDCIAVQQDEIAGNCRLLQEECVWIVSHEDDSETYENAVFDFAADGTLKFYNNGEFFQGTRIVFFIEDELHTNIVLDNTEQIGNDWNYDWKTTILSDNEMIFFNGETTLTLTKECDGNFCTTLEFEECEGIIGSQISTFVFEDYISCILQIEDLNELTENDSIGFFETEADAQTETNMLSQTSYQNTAPEQTIYVSVYYNDTDEIFIIPITIRSISC